MNDQMVHEHSDVEFEPNIHNDHNSDGVHQPMEEERDDAESIPLEYILKMQRYEEMKNKQPTERDAPEPTKSSNSFSSKGGLNY
eukprot:scaffold57678_cov40-Cyclotella_meneghiniana.AAC.6